MHPDFFTWHLFITTTLIVVLVVVSKIQLLPSDVLTVNMQFGF